MEQLMSRLKLSVNTRGATAKFSAVLREIKRQEESVVRQEARGLAVELVRRTQPFGLREGDGDSFAGRIESDSRRVFVAPSDIWDEVVRIDPDMARAKWAEFKRGDWNQIRQLLQRSGSARLQQLLIGARPDPSLHRRARNRTRKRAVPKNWPGSQLMTNANARDNYVRRRGRRAGYTASGWVTAARGLRGTVRGIPRWKAYGRHKAPGTGIVSSRARGVQAMLHNRVPWVSDALTKQEQRRAERIAAEKFVKALEESKKKAVQIANRQAKRDARR
jgi:hypothetical protein